MDYFFFRTRTSVLVLNASSGQNISWFHNALKCSDSCKYDPRIPSNKIQHKLTSSYFNERIAWIASMRSNFFIRRPFIQSASFNLHTLTITLFLYRSRFTRPKIQPICRSPTTQPNSFPWKVRLIITNNNPATKTNLDKFAKTFFYWVFGILVATVCTLSCGNW